MEQQRRLHSLQCFIDNGLKGDPEEAAEMAER